mmetsp:Transcript_69649/g.167152  ORF Transcript_69649/g.167152 Transcript_69649/m.167152 type:complete len:205 (-) Transcript_69649:1280-1894(-)
MCVCAARIQCGVYEKYPQGDTRCVTVVPHLMLKAIIKDQRLALDHGGGVVRHSPPTAILWNNQWQMDGQFRVCRPAMRSYVCIGTDNAVASIQDLQVLWIARRMLWIIEHAKLLHHLTQLRGALIAHIPILCWMFLCILVCGVEDPEWINWPDEVLPPSTKLRVMEGEAILVGLLATLRFLFSPLRELFDHVVKVLLKEIKSLH